MTAFCPSCGAPRTADTRFCGNCGHRFDDIGARPEAERRQLTVLFCDVAGSMGLSARLDPEDLRELMRDYQHAASEMIRRHDGHIAQYLGDGILAYFGYPVAHEDDARRAIRSGLELVEAVRAVSARWESSHGVPFQVRVGIHTGLVVIGEMGAQGRHEQLATGEVPNIAARIQGAAEPDTVVVSQVTHRLVQGYFATTDLGSATLKGVEQPIVLHRVDGETGAESRLDAAAAAGLSPFIGRGSEMALLNRLWSEVAGGGKRVVLLRGEAGIGKSRHVRELMERLAQGNAVVRTAQCSPYFESSEFHPLAELLERTYGFTSDTDSGTKLTRISERLTQLGVPDVPQATALLGALLSVPLPAGVAPLKLTPQGQRRQTIELLRTMLAALARERPALVVVEDLHWADPSTRDVLEDMILQLENVPFMLLCTARPEFTTGWEGHSGVTVIDLVRLSDPASSEIISRMTSEFALPDEVVRRIVARAEGIPLYVEEITKAVLESGSDGDAAADQLSDAIPATVQDSLLARLDRTGKGKPVAQLASAIGRDFSFELLSAVTELSRGELEQALNRLVDSELLLQRGAVPASEYTFKHALIQDAAYQSLLRSRRQDIHRTIATALTERFPAMAESRPELPAQHYTAAGQALQAIPFWQKAGERAAQRSANFEAASHLTRALELVRSLPDSAEKVQFELALSITLGPILMATRGYANPEVEATYRRAREICTAIGDTPQIVPVLFGLWAFYVVRGSLNTARDLGEQILRLVGGANDSGILLESHIVLGVTLYFRGELTEARDHLLQAVELYEPAEHRAHALIFGQEPGMASHIYLAKTLAVMGDLEGAEKHRGEAARIAAETDHHHTSAFCMVYETVVKHLQGDIDATIELADRTISLSEEHGFPIWKAGAEVLKGYALTLRGERMQGMQLIQAAIEGWRATGTNLYTPYWTGLLAMAAHADGDAARARELAQAGLEAEEQGEEGLALAELHRLSAELAAAGGNKAGAKAGIEKALEIARRQSAGYWEQKALATAQQLLN